MNLDFRTLETPGAITIIEAVDQGRAEVGFVGADLAFLAFNGRLDDRSDSFPRLRGIAVFRSTVIHLVVRGDSGIRSIRDLRGRRVAFGLAATGGTTRANMILRAFGVIHAELLPPREASAALVAGNIDAMFLGATYPAEPVVAAVHAGARLLSIEESAIDALRRDSPFVRAVAIPAGLYPGQTDTIRTIGIDRVVVYRSDLDDDLVYKLTEQFFETVRGRAGAQGSLGLDDLNQSSATPIPLHDGAARYYRRMELLR